MTALNIIAYGSYADERNDDSEATDLRELLASVCQHRFRRIDRFTQLCLIGSGLCQQQFDQNLDPRTTLYLASRMASVSNTVGVQEQIFKRRMPPKPVHFINTLSNAAGFYVAKNLQLKGENYFVTRSDAVFESALDLAWQGSQLPSPRPTLIGMVEECGQEPKQHRQRLGLAPDAPLTEDSHWILLNSGHYEGESYGCITHISHLRSANELEQALAEHLSTQTMVHCSSDLPTRAQDIINDANCADTDIGNASSNSAANLIRFLQSERNGSLLSIVRLADNRFHFTRVDKD